LTHALLLLLQKLSNPALQLVSLGLVGGIPVVQLFGHVHRGRTVLVASLQCSFLICKDLKLRKCQDKRIMARVKGFEVQVEW
jgi:hypothetical protein